MGATRREGPRLGHLPAQSCRRERWANGQGWTRVVAAGPGSPPSWRLSIAEITSDGPFSLFPGQRRIQVLLSGDGFTLVPGEGAAPTLDPPFGQAAYDGSLVVHCRLHGGPCTALNLIWSPDRMEAQVLHRPLVGPMYVFAAAGETWLVHLAAGSATAAADGADGPGAVLLEQGDTAVLEAGGRGGRLALEGGGDLVLLRLRSTATAGLEDDQAAG